MSTYIRGVISSDNEEYKKQSKVLLACAEAGVKELPTETAEFFGSSSPDKYLLDEVLEINLPYYEITEGDKNVFKIDVANIPKAVKYIKFVNSY